METSKAQPKAKTDKLKSVPQPEYDEHDLTISPMEEVGDRVDKSAPVNWKSTESEGQRRSTDSSRASSSDRASPATNATSAQYSAASTERTEKRIQRERKRVEQLLMEMSLLANDNARVHELCNKHAALMEQNQVMQKTLKETQKMYTQVVSERSQVQEDMKKLLLTKLKLEALCRELQKQNKDIKSEHMERLKMDEESRQQLTTQVKGSLEEIQTQMAASKERSDRLATENGTLLKKLEAMSEQCSARDEHSQKLMATHDIERQLYEAKLKAAALQHEKDIEDRLKAEHALLLKLKQRDEQLSEAIDAEKSLREQMSLYAAKYDELHTSLADSNDTFEKFKNEMQRMNTNMIRVERECRQWKSKFDETSAALLLEASTRAEYQTKCDQQTAKIIKLEQLCRALQTDRKRRLNGEEVGDSGPALNEIPSGVPETDKVSDHNGNGEEEHQSVGTPVAAT